MFSRQHRDGSNGGNDHDTNEIWSTSNARYNYGFEQFGLQRQAIYGVVEYCLWLALRGVVSVWIFTQSYLPVSFLYQPPPTLPPMLFEC